MTLEELIDGIEKSASTIKKPEDSTEVTQPTVAAELEQVLSKEASATDAKDAYTAGEKLAAALLEKLASDKNTATTAAPAAVVPAEVTTEDVVKTASENTETQENKGTEMNKQASNKELATKIMEKLAGEENNVATAAGVSPAPNKVQIDTAQMVAQQTANIQPNPGSGGPLNQMVDEIVAKALAMGAVPMDTVPAAAGAVSAIASKDGTDPAMGTPTIDGEKQAAVQALLDAGCDWDSAVDMVKAAAAEIDAEEYSQVKMAAVQDLVGRGIDFDSAVSLVTNAIEAE